jgi:hypothetical protein
MRRDWGPFALAIVLSGATAAAGAEPPKPGPSDAAAATADRSWTVGVEAYAYLQQEDGNFVLPILRADHGSLHLEARYQYEDRKTFSAWAGWAFETGKTLQLQVVPMVGAIVGQTDGVAPGLEFTLSWKSLSLYGEAEYVFDLEGKDGNFFYYWSELGWQATPWLSLGLAAQRTRLFQSELAIDRGLFAALTWEPVTLKAYGYNLDGESPFGIVALAVDF